MKSIRTIIVDDEGPARARLRRMLEGMGNVEILADCDDGKTALDAIQEQAPELLFLDISMPGIDGFDVVSAIASHDRQPLIVFCTAYDHFAIRAFDACALDYLLKPVSQERLARALARCRERLSHPESGGTEIDPAATEDPRRFVVHQGGRITFVSPEEIDWIEAAGNYAILHVDGRSLMVRETMSGLESRLEDSGFSRTSRSTIVNLRKVRELRSGAVGKKIALLLGGQEIRVTHSFKKLRERLADLP